jgi:hypothetical protein
MFRIDPRITDNDLKSRKSFLLWSPFELFDTPFVRNCPTKENTFTGESEPPHIRGNHENNPGRYQPCQEKAAG